MVCNGIATIVSTLARLQQGHEMQIAHTHVAEVIEVVAYTFEGAGEMVGIGCITESSSVVEASRAPRGGLRRGA